VTGGRLSPLGKWELFWLCLADEGGDWEAPLVGMADERADDECLGEEGDRVVAKQRMDQGSLETSFHRILP
jgi:hypothetical protein